MTCARIPTATTAGLPAQRRPRRDSGSRGQQPAGHPNTPECKGRHRRVQVLGHHPETAGVSAVAAGGGGAGRNGRGPRPPPTKRGQNPTETEGPRGGRRGKAEWVGAGGIHKQAGTKPEGNRKPGGYKALRLAGVVRWRVIRTAHGSTFGDLLALGQACGGGGPVGE